MQMRSSDLAAATLKVQRGSLKVPAKKEIAMQLVSSAENSSLDWKVQYAYIAYNVEHDLYENRGYTGGIIGFTSRTGDMLALVRHYTRIAPNNALTPYLSALEEVNGTALKTGLGKPFLKAWKTAALDPKFLRAQDYVRDRSYFNPAVRRAEADRLQELGQFIYYDAMVMHGPGTDPSCFGGLRKVSLKLAKPPSSGGDETHYLHTFLDVRKAIMKSEAGHQDTSRIDTMQRKFLRQGNLRLELPLAFKVYGDAYKIC